MLVSYAEPQSKGLVAFQLNASDLHRLDLILRDPGLRYENATAGAAGTPSPPTAAMMWAGADPDSIVGLATRGSGLALTIRVSPDDLRRFRILLQDQTLSWNAERAVHQAGHVIDALDQLIRAEVPEETASLVLTAINHRFHARSNQA